MLDSIKERLESQRTDYMRQSHRYDYFPITTVTKSKVGLNTNVLNSLIAGFSKFNLKKLSKNDGATEFNTIYAGRNFTIKPFLGAYGLDEKFVFILDMADGWIRSSPINKVSVIEDKYIILHTLNSVYELEMIKGEV